MKPKVNKFAFGNNVYALCKERDVKLTDLANMLGVHINTISAWVNGRRKPDAYCVYYIAKALGVSVDRLMQGTDPDGE